MKIMPALNKIKNGLFNILVKTWIFKFFARVFARTAITGEGSRVCLKNNFLPVPVHFYSPIPDIDDLEKRNVWDVRSKLVGIDFNEEEQKKLLKEFGANYGAECRWPETAADDSIDFFTDNTTFSYGCAASTHGMIRHFKPKRVIEIGSGMSSRVIAGALQKNKEEGVESSYTVVDPYPGETVKNGSLKIKKLIEDRIELLDSSFFNELEANDILFVDSGHCVRIGSDVNFLILDILPTLAPGVIIHFHDISLPYEYSKAYATNESFRQFWTEQYLLQSFLTFNSEFEILLTMNYLMVDHIDLFRNCFPYYNPAKHPFTSGSFWIQRKT